MTILQALILGIVQGLTEFLPISSSGHLILVPWLFGWNFFQVHPDLNKTFDVALHLGTFIAAVVYFWRQIVVILRAWVHSLRTRRIETADERLAWLLLISTVPAGLVGVAFESFVEDQLGKPYLICIMMIAFALVMLVADRTAQLNKIDDRPALAGRPGHRRRPGRRPVAGRLALGHHHGHRPVHGSRPRIDRALLVPAVGPGGRRRGCAQAGSARQGRHAAAHGAPFLVGTVAAAVSGLAAIWFVLSYLRTHTFTIFVVYRLVVASALLIVIATGARHATGI